MRPLPLLSAACVLALALALPSAGATPTWGCHSYEIYVGDHEQGAGVSTDDGAVAVAAAGWYVVNDGPPVLNPWIVSIWIYQESNGMEGLQRGDDVCDETNGGQTPCDCWYL